MGCRESDPALKSVVKQQGCSQRVATSQGRELRIHTHTCHVSCVTRPLGFAAHPGSCSCPGCEGSCLVAGPVMHTAPQSGFAGGATPGPPQTPDDVCSTPRQASAATVTEAPSRGEQSRQSSRGVQAPRVCVCVCAACWRQLRCGQPCLQGGGVGCRDPGQDRAACVGGVCHLQKSRAGLALLGRRSSGDPPGNDSRLRAAQVARSKRVPSRNPLETPFPIAWTPGAELGHLLGFGERGSGAVASGPTQPTSWTGL